MLENVTEGDLAIFKNGEEGKVVSILVRDYDSISLRFDKLISCKTKKSDVSRWWAYRYSGEWNGNIQDRNDIVKIIHMEEG